MPDKNCTAWHNDDFDGLDESELQPEIIESIRQARIEARSIIGRLEPKHIDGWSSLIDVLRESLESAEQNARQMTPSLLREMAEAVRKNLRWLIP